MTNTEISFKSNVNKATSMKDHTRCSFHRNETHMEEDSPADNKNGSHLKRNTPILFSTNRGIHLRMTTSNTSSLNSTNTTSIPKMNSTYSTLFCDLERWSSNRANTISLEDTFTVPKPAVASGSLVCNSLRYLPCNSTSVHFNGYSRFDVE